MAPEGARRRAPERAREGGRDRTSERGAGRDERAAARKSRAAAIAATAEAMSACARASPCGSYFPRASTAERPAASSATTKGSDRTDVAEAVAVLQAAARSLELVGVFGPRAGDLAHRNTDDAGPVPHFAVQKPVDGDLAVAEDRLAHEEGVVRVGHLPDRRGEVDGEGGREDDRGQRRVTPGGRSRGRGSRGQAAAF